MLLTIVCDCDSSSQVVRLRVFTHERSTIAWVSDLRSLCPLNALLFPGCQMTCSNYIGCGGSSAITDRLVTRSAIAVLSKFRLRFRSRAGKGRALTVCEMAKLMGYDTNRLEIMCHENSFKHMLGMAVHRSTMGFALMGLIASLRPPVS